MIIPIKPNFEENVLFFLETHQIWKGGKLPVINKESYKAYLNELHSSKQLEKGNGIPVGDIWEIKLPTSFVILQTHEDGTPDGSMPSGLCTEILPVALSEDLDLELPVVDAAIEEDIDDILTEETEE